MFHSDLLQRAVSAVQTSDRVRALTKDRPIDLTSIERYLRAKLGEASLRPDGRQLLLLR